MKTLLSTLVTIGLLCGSALAAAPATQGKAGAPADGVRIRGRVVDPDGKPVAAKVLLPALPAADDPQPGAALAETTAGPDGRYELSIPAASMPPAAQVVAHADGFGVAFAPWSRESDAEADIELKLAKDDVPIEGRVLDLEGEPVKGVTVTVDAVASLDEPPPQVDPRRVQPGLPPVANTSQRALARPLVAIGRREPIVTGADGRFRIEGLGRERHVTLQLQGQRIGLSRVETMTKPIAPATQPADADAPPQPAGNVPPGAFPRGNVLPPKFDFTAGPGRTVQGVIKDAATSAPMAGVVVQSLTLAGPMAYPAPGAIRAVTDAQGQYKLDGFPKGKGNAILVVPPNDRPYFMREAQLDDEPGLKPIKLDLELHKGVWITGRITDRKTGASLPARVQYTTYLENKTTEGLPEFRQENGMGYMAGNPQPREAGPDGTYRLVAAPGKAVIAATSTIPRYRKGVGKDQIEPLSKNREAFRTMLFQPFGSPDQCHAIREIEVPAGAESVTCDLQLDPGESIRVVAIDRRGQPASGKLLVRGHMLEADAAGAAASGELIRQPLFEAFGFGPGDARMLYVIDDDNKLGRATWVQYDELPERVMKVKLLPLVEVKGRLVGPDEKPLAKAKLNATESGAADGFAVRSATTDDDGRFVLTLPIGARYRLAMEGGQYQGTNVGPELTPRQNEPKDLGDVAPGGMMAK